MATPFLPAGATTGDSGGELSSGDDSGDLESFQTPEAEATRSLAELFEKAAAHVQGLVQVASREQLLYLYARYKQVKVGNCNIPKPNFFDFEGKQKWEAWKALGDSSPSQAMQEYIAAVKKLDPGWNPQQRLQDLCFGIDDVNFDHLDNDGVYQVSLPRSSCFFIINLPHFIQSLLNNSHHCYSKSCLCSQAFESCRL
nr:acyl-CoA-binding domain-containing protein 6 isoform X4 [Rattus norvegicus]|eukprot:XP_006250094.1 PREDICTED: acyl-CoA-binding domain-containing protein 6 isoform X2 [Rattus norvegicus]